MAGGKGEAAGAVSSRAGYRISRIEAPAPVEILRSNNAGSGGRRGGDSSEVEARIEQHEHATRSRGGGRCGTKNNRGGKGRRGKRGGWEHQESLSTSAGTIGARKDCSDHSVTFSKIGDWDRAVSSRHSSQNHHHHHQPRGGGPRKNQTHVNSIQIGGLPSSYLALPQDSHLRRGRLHDVEVGTSRGFTRAPREERQQVGRLQGFGRDNGEGLKEKSNLGASSAIGSIGRERSTTARVGPYEGQMLRQSVGHQAHSLESSPRPCRDAGEGLSSRAGISGTRYSKASSSLQHAKGTCMSMCPVEEARSREAEGALSVFEATDATVMLPFRQRVADPNRTVKKYRRSAAGRDMDRYVKGFLIKGAIE